MSADNGYILRRNQFGKFALQMYFASNESYPPIAWDSTKDLIFDSVDSAIYYYEKNMNGELWSEYGLTIDLSGTAPLEYNSPKLRNTTKENSTMETSTYQSVPYQIEAVQVTDDNMVEVAEWAHALLDRTGPHEPTFIKVDVKNPLSEKQTMAFVGDWVLKGKNGFKVYKDRPFKNNFTKIGDDVAERGRNLLKQESVSDEELEKLVAQLTAHLKGDKDESPSEPVVENIFDKAADSPQIQTYVSEKDAIAGKQ